MTRPLTDWSVYVELDVTDAPDDLHDLAVERLADHAAVPTTSPTGRFAVVLSVRAISAQVAVIEGARAVQELAEPHFDSVPVYALEVLHPDEEDRRTNEPRQQ